MKKEKIQIKRSEVVFYAVTVVKDKEYGRCGTCKHYQQAVTCGACYHDSRYCFDWRSYYNLHKEEILIQKAYNNLKKRGYSHPLDTCYYSLLGVLQREGEDALESYIEKVNFN